MRIDYKLNWKEHIKKIKTDCMKRMDILKCVSNTTWGSDRIIMLRLYRALIRSKLDYCSFIYGSARNCDLKSLDPVHNAGIRFCTGAYRSSPVESLYAESREAPLQSRRELLLMQYYARTMQLPNSTSYRIVQRNETNEPTLITNICERIKLIEDRMGITIRTLPFIYPDTPIWETETTIICEEYNYPRKEDCTAYAMRCYYNEHVTIHHSDQYYIFTDGAKNANGVGCAAICYDKSKKCRLLEESSIYTAELYGVLCALDLVAGIQRSRFLIQCDSRSVLQSIRHFNSTHPLVIKVLVQLYQLKTQQKSVQFCWCPSHVGILGNEAADRAATDAANSNLPIHSDRLPAKDWYPHIKRRVNEQWNERWRAVTGNKLREIKDSVKVWSSSTQPTRKASIILTRIRIGHTKITHQFLMEKRHQPYCGDCLVPLTVRHFLAECPTFADERRLLFPRARNLNTEQTMRMMLSETETSTPDITTLMEYLRSINILNEII